MFTESVIGKMPRICNAAGGYNLSQGFPDFESPAEVKEAAIAAINAGRNQCSIAHGEAVSARTAAMTCRASSGTCRIP